MPLTSDFKKLVDAATKDNGPVPNTILAVNMVNGETDAHVKSIVLDTRVVDYFFGVSYAHEWTFVCRSGDTMYFSTRSIFQDKFLKQLITDLEGEGLDVLLMYASETAKMYDATTHVESVQ